MGVRGSDHHKSLPVGDDRVGRASRRDEVSHLTCEAGGRLRDERLPRMLCELSRNRVSFQLKEPPACLPIFRGNAESAQDFTTSLNCDGDFRAKAIGRE
jgi:hypothetical protein